MSLSDLAAIGSFISGFAVLVSLIFLYFQLRQVNAQVLQTEKNQRALMNQGVIARGMESNYRQMEPEMVDIHLKIRAGATDFSEREAFRLMTFYRNLSLHVQDAHVQNRSGLLDQTIFDTSLIGFKHHLSTPAFRAYWKTSRIAASLEWAAYVDQLIAETPLRPRTEFAAQFNADIEQVMR